MGIKVLSLFDGISCGMVALERAGFKVDEYIAYEIEEDAIKVSKSNYPEIIQKGDVFKADFTEHDYKIIDFSKYKDSVKWNKDNTVCYYDPSGKGYYSQAARCRKITAKSNTLTASGNDKNNIYLGDYKCRILHPIEAERLQTLPDNYTACLGSKVRRSELCGNGWTVDVIVHLLKGLPNIEKEYEES